jgi:3-oxoacyl-[acyl-carrier-protein] synthase II
MLAGGAESCIDPISMAGFCRLKALSTSFNQCPNSASRPFHTQRDGFVMAEGAAILVLEEINHAIARNATILCEIRGYGLSGDAHHITSPDPLGKGAIRAMKIALHDAGFKPNQVNYVNAHATSTPLGDEIEAKAIESAILSSSHLNQRQMELFVSSTKGATGHLLGAAGALEAAFTVMTLATGILPHTMNLDNEHVCDVDVNFRHILDSPLHRNIDVAISNSFGFGGTNSCLVLSKVNNGILWDK